MKRACFERVLTILLFFSFHLIFPGCGGEKPGSHRAGNREEQSNIILLTIDTIRADHLGCYGAENIRTPGMDLLAGEGVLCEKAVASAPLTLPSHCSILTGLYPADHGVLDNGGFTLDGGQTLVSEMLRDAGYETAAFVGAFVVDQRWGLGQGFDHFSSDLHLGRYEDVSLEIERRGDEVIRDFLSWLDQNHQKPFFVWLHLFDPHDPYDPPPPFNETYRGRPYEGEIAYTDALVQTLRAELKKRALWKDLLFILVGDHGESLGEHGEQTHAYFVYNSTLLVPMILKFPDMAHGGQRIETLVRTVDIVPTLMDYLELASPISFRGRSLLPYLTSPGPGDLPGYSESHYARTHFGWGSLRAVMDGRYKYIDAPRPELYDLNLDPGETKNIMDDKPQIAAALKKEMEKILEQSATGGWLPEPASMDSETRARLEALGYLTAAPSPDQQEARRADPKDMLETYKTLNTAMGLIREKRYGEAEPLLEAVLKQDPRIIDARFNLALVYLDTGRYEAAIKENLSVLDMKPDFSTAAMNLAIALQKTGRIEEAAAWFEKTIALEPSQLKAYRALAGIYADQEKYRKAVQLLENALNYDEENIKALLQLAIVLEKSGHPAGAERAAEKIIETDARCAEAYLLLGILSLKDGQLGAAERNVRQALSINPALKDVHFNLGVILDQKGEKAVSAEAYRMEIKNNPRHFKARTNLAILYGEMGDPDRKIRELKELMSIKPGFYLPYYLTAETYFRLQTNTGEATRLAQKCIELNPQFSRAYHLLIQIYEGQDMRAEADKLREKYDRLFRDQPPL